MLNNLLYNRLHKNNVICCKCKNKCVNFYDILIFNRINSVY